MSSPTVEQAPANPVPVPEAFYVVLEQPLRYRYQEVTYLKGVVVEVDRPLFRYLMRGQKVAAFRQVIPEDVEEEREALREANERAGKGDMKRSDLGLIDTAVDKTPRREIRRTGTGRAPVEA